MAGLWDTKKISIPKIASVSKDPRIHLNSRWGMTAKGSLRMEDGLPGLGYGVNIHGDRKSPKDRVVGPLPNGLNGL